MGGLDRYQHQVCNEHSKLGVEVTTWLQSRHKEIHGQAYGICVYANPAESRRIKFGKLRRLANEYFHDRGIIFVSHHASVSAGLLRNLFGVPHVVHFHGPWAEEAAIEGTAGWKTFLQARDERKVYHAADRIITLSEAFKRLVVERYGALEERVHVIPGGIDTTAAIPNCSRTEAREEMGWPRSRPIVLCVRRLVRRVGVDVLVEAVGKLVRECKAGTDLLVLIGGTGPLKEELAQRIQYLGIEKNVRLLGFVPEPILSTAYRAADLSIVPTQLLEGFGLVTLESLAVGTPVLVTPVGSLPEIVSDLSLNLLLPGKGVDSICSGLRAFVKGTIKLPSEIACREYVRNRYSWSIIAPRVLEIYKNALTY